MAVSSRVVTKGDFSFIHLQSNHGMRMPDHGIYVNYHEEVLAQLDKFRVDNPDKKIVSFQVESRDFHGTTFIQGIYVHHETKEAK